MSLDASEFDLSDDELRAGWGHVQRRFFASVTRSPKPLAVFVGAQPGAGKTRTVERVRSWHPDRDFVVLDSDVMRKAHPRFAEIMQRDPSRMAVLTNQAASAWFRMGLADVHAGGYDVLVENTFHDATVVLTEARQFHDEGYRVEAVALAVAAADSRLGMVDRYFNAIGFGDPPRWTTNAAHDRGYAGAPATLDALEQAEVVDRVVVTGRTGTVHYDSSDLSNIDPSAAAALHRVRAAAKSPAEAARWLTAHRVIEQRAVDQDVRNDPAMVSVFDSLAQEAAVIQTQSARTSADALAEALALRDGAVTASRDRPSGEVEAGRSTNIDCER